jgi:endonuclease/exonuclease/phosphatase family metal-dependent hydrolase
VPKPAEPARLRVATLNVWGRFADWPTRLEVLGERSHEISADVLMLQEVCRDDWGDQATQIADWLGYPIVAATQGHEIPGGAEGVAILSRTTLEDVTVEDLPASLPRRRALMATLPRSGHTLRLVCGHTVAVPEHVRTLQARALLAHTEAPLVIGADLNAPPDELDGALKRARLGDALAGDPTPTWPVCDVTFGDAWTSQFGRAPHFSLTPRRLDYLLGRGIRVHDAGVQTLGSPGRGFASDHAAVWADITIDPD